MLYCVILHYIKLEDLSPEVFHGVDCTRIAINPTLMHLKGTIGAIYYNYPHAGAVGGFFDGHPVVNWRHENIMRPVPARFLGAAFLQTGSIPLGSVLLVCFSNGIDPVSLRCVGGDMRRCRSP